MEFLQPIADLLGITVGQLVGISVALLALTIFWFLIKQAIKLATRIFTIGCLTIVVIGVGLYLFFVIAQ